METLVGIIALLTVAVIQITATAALFRRYTNLVLFSYLIYLILWDLYAIAQFIFIYYLRYLPEAGKLSYFLFFGILWIMVHGLTVVFFADFICQWMNKRLSWIIKILHFLPFLIIQITYTHHAVTRLIHDPEPKFFQVTAPYSVNLMFILMFFWLIYAIFAAGKLNDLFLKKRIRLFSYMTIGGMAAAMSLTYIPLSELNFLWIFALTSCLYLAVNVPGFLILRVYYKKHRSRMMNGEISEKIIRLQQVHGLTPREAEIISLVLAGNSNREIANQVHISLETIKKHIYNVYKKIGVKNRLQLMNTFRG